MQKKISEYLFLWTLGGAIYYCIEIVYRGFSHWSMFVLGGLCFVFFAQQGMWAGWREPLWKQVLWSTVFVSSCEFITGIFVNRILGWNVWDYSDQPFQIMGQICLAYTIMFSGLCALGIILSGYALHYLYGEKDPGFHVL